MKTDPGTIYIAHRHMNVEIGAEAALFPQKEYISGIFVAVQAQYSTQTQMRNPRLLNLTNVYIRKY
jgi:hypothetical protein